MTVLGIYRARQPQSLRVKAEEEDAMLTPNQRITPFLWFDDQAEEAARFYTSIFPNSSIQRVTRYGPEGAEASGRPAGTVMTVAFWLDGQDFIALNGGPVFRFTEAVSFVVNCVTQEEIDHYWDKLGAGGDPAAQQCGWLKDRYGVSWQIVPAVLGELLNDGDPRRARRAMKALLGMKKLDIAALKWAADSEGAV
jgi:predicted 3-demethylubiquinone-9 3-methyltransferase (glyoxalase superfamily)